MVLDVEAVKVKVESLHKGPLLVTVGVAGVGLTTTVVDAGAETQFAMVTVTEYVPACVVAIFVIVGF
jgi:hypothetical protein